MEDVRVIAVQHRRSPEGIKAERRSERLQILDEISLLIWREPKLTNPVVLRHDVGERGRATVVEVRRVLPQRTQRSCAVGLVGGARRIRPVDARVRRRVQCPAVVIGARPANVAARARPVKDGASAVSDGCIEASSRRWRRGEAAVSYTHLTLPTTPYV